MNQLRSAFSVPSLRSEPALIRAKGQALSVLSVLSVLSAAPVAAQQRCGEIILATTTSTQDTGLLDSLLPMFQRETCIEVKPIAVGTGAALEMARRGDADAVLVHAPEAERTYVDQGMGATLLIAEARQTYTLTDRGTYLAFKARLNLVPLVEGDPRLRNIYHAYVVNPGKHPTVHRSEAARFVRYLTDPKVQEWIGRFGRAKFGQALFVPDAQDTSAKPSQPEETSGRSAARSH